MTIHRLTLSSRIRRTPFNDRLETLGVSSYPSYNQMLLATALKSIEEDYWHLRQHVQIWDVNCQRIVEVLGTDAARLVQIMIPRDLSKAVFG